MPESLHPVQRLGREIQRLSRPRTLGDALADLAADPEARPISGGTDLLLDLHRGGLGQPVTLVDLNGVDELRGIDIGAERVQLGALTTHNDVVAHPDLRRVALPLAQACLEIGSPQLRNRATIAGNLATASPANDTISALLALDASVTLRSAARERTVALDDLFTGFRSTVIEPGELITAISFPPLSSPFDGMWAKLGNRAAQAISVIHLGVVVERDAGDTVTTARLAIGSVAERVVRVPEAEAVLLGTSLDPAAIDAAATAVQTAVAPIDDVRATADYRTDLIPTLVRRTLTSLREGRAATTWPAEPPCLGRRTGHPGAGTGAVDDTVSIAIELNGATVTGQGAAGRTLLDWLRGVAGLTGTKEGCAEGECGACTVVLDGQAVMSCLVNAAQADGSTVTTVEGVGDSHGPSPLQQAFAEEFAVQCGFCIPGFIVAGSALLDETPDPTDEQIKLGLSGNLCRCTGYYPIEQAVRVAAGNDT